MDTILTCISITTLLYIQYTSCLQAKVGYTKCFYSVNKIDWNAEFEKKYGEYS